eukprot:CAMPEP_0178929326 /NCGR_PEP_ID=MMETSP0786-20121207/20509_1 /TAXON_ID=186022 /ORGANISM="Thalassionema frauenfeldii, Strain CCMP 1798" /LENGTH=146 /DNA_ID=CAMNT_0020605513 /DNA_START=184 /DNA_END=624 /DNA_ORIENTATION=-
MNSKPYSQQNGECQRAKDSLLATGLKESILNTKDSFAWRKQLNAQSSVRKLDKFLQKQQDVTFRENQTKDDLSIQAISSKSFKRKPKSNVLQRRSSLSSLPNNVSPRYAYDDCNDSEHSEHSVKTEMRSGSTKQAILLMKYNEAIP